MNEVGSLEAVRWTIAVVFVMFAIYTLYCVWKEPFFKTVKAIWKFHWGRQVTADLYIGILLFSFIVYLVEDAILPTAIWSVMTMIFGNWVSLIYFFVHFDKIIAHFA